MAARQTARQRRPIAKLVLLTTLTFTRFANPGPAPADDAPTPAAGEPGATQPIPLASAGMPASPEPAVPVSSRGSPAAAPPRADSSPPPSDPPPSGAAFYSPEPPPPIRNVTLSVSPVHWLLPVAELMAEIRAASFAGLALIGGIGIGEVTATDNLGERHGFSAWEAGGQANFYLMHDFCGLHVGAEVLYMNMSGNQARGDMTGTAHGLAIGPLVGYKLVTGVGFTFLAQGGVEHLTARARAEQTSTGETASDEDWQFIPLLNLNLGWSF